MSKIEVYPGPNTESYRSSKFQVFALNDKQEYETCYVYCASAKAWANGGSTLPRRNQFWVSGSYPSISYLTIGCEEEVNLRIKYHQPISAVDVGPHSLNKVCYVESNDTLNITGKPGEKLFIAFNDNYQDTLIVSIDNLKPSVPENAIYFGPGVHDIGFCFSSINGEILNDKVFYLDGGAYLKGSFYLVSSNNITIMGPGVLSCESWYDQALSKLRSSTGTSNSWNTMLNNHYFPIEARHTYGQAAPNGRNTSTGIKLDGITVVKYPAHGPKGINYINNCKFISPWEFSTDGPLMQPDRALDPPLAVCKNTLIFNMDDVVASINKNYDGNIVYENLYLLNANNGPFVVTYSTQYNGPKLYKTTVTNVDVRQFDEEKTNDPNALFKLYLGSNNSNAIPPNWGAFNAEFKDIRFEGTTKSKHFHFVNGKEPFKPENRNFSGATSGLVFDNITINCPEQFVSKSFICSLDDVNKISNILFKDIVINGVTITRNNYTNFFSLSGSTNIDRHNIVFVKTK